MHGDEPCDTAGKYYRCTTTTDGEAWFSVYCPEGVDPPPPGRNASTSGCSGGCSAGTGPTGSVVLVLLMLLAHHRR